MSTIDYKALAERVAQRAIYAENNADPNNKAWAADLRAVVSLLNGMADAQPVAWRTFDGEGNYNYRDYELNEDYADEWNRRNPKHVGWVEPLYAHPAPAAPQAEPMADSDADYWLRNRQPILDAIERAGFMLMSNASGFWLHPRGKTDAQAEPIDPHMIVAEDRFPDVSAEPKRDWTAVDAAIREYLDNYELIGEDDAGADAYYTPTERELYLIYDAINGLLEDESFVAAISTPQTETKREALSYDEILDIATAAGLRFSMYSDDVETRAAIKRLARAVERAAYKRAAQECLATAAELRRCADGCTDGRYDWKADGALDCADAIHALGRQQ